MADDYKHDQFKFSAFQVLEATNSVTATQTVYCLGGRILVMPTGFIEVAMFVIDVGV